MRAIKSSIVGLGISGLAFLAMSSSVFAGTLLVTSEEASLPPLKGAVAMASRGVTRGPRIELADIGKDGLRSPVHLLVNFKTFGGAMIDLDSVHVTYLKTPNVDLTQRVKPFVRPAGIDMPDAEFPAGDHLLRVDVKDSDGRTSTASFALTVKP